MDGNTGRKDVDDTTESPSIDQLESTDSQPLRTLSRDGRRDEVAEFAKLNGLMHKVDVFEKAAVLLHSDVAIAQVPNISADEIQALRRETDKPWSQPLSLYFTILVCSFAAMEQGWAQTCMNGANLYFPKTFGIDSKSPRDTFIVGLINAGIYFSVGVFGAWCSEPVNNRLGRRGTVFTGSMICIVANLASALSQSWPQLLAFRFLLGVGLGLNNSTISIFAAESAPPRIRGGLAVSWQMFTAFGIFVGFVANVAVYNVS